MKNPKPSLLPERTVIGTGAPHYEDLYIKGADGVWEDLFSGCGCCVDHERIGDAGCETIFKCGGLRLTTEQKSDEYFTDFKIIASDPSVYFDIEALHGPWVDVYGMYFDRTLDHDCKGYNCDA